MNFELDSRIENDSVFLCDWPLSQVRLHRNAAFPWLMLMPRRADMREIIDLGEEDQWQLLREIRFASQVLQDVYRPTKLNVANLGNVVAQLHVHVIARFEADPAWPGPVWNSGVSEIHSDEELAAEVTKFQSLLQDFPG